MGRCLLCYIPEILYIQSVVLVVLCTAGGCVSRERYDAGRYECGLGEGSVRKGGKGLC